MPRRKNWISIHKRAEAPKDSDRMGARSTKVHGGFHDTTRGVEVSNIP
jgi:hypothetical protein